MTFRIHVARDFKIWNKSALQSEKLKFWKISAKSDNVIFIDFEDASNLSAIPNYSALLKYVDEHRKKSRCYVFLDEVQRVDKWADACRTLRLRNCSVFIGGLLLS